MNHDVVSKLVRTGFILGLVASTPARAATAEEEAPPLRLQSMGVFYVGGRSGQGHLPVAGLSSSIYLGTPDGREGWAQYFARRGHPLYAVDLPDRSSASFPIDAINGCTHGDEGYPCSEVALGKTSLEQPWSVWGFGPVFGQQFDDSRFPALPLQERYVEQFAAGFEISAGSGAGPRVVATAAELASQNVPAAFIDLPGDLAIRGNSHLMMQDNNSDDLAALISDWLQSLD